MKKLIIAAFLTAALLFNANGQELIEHSKQIIEYEVMDEGGSGYYPCYTPVSTSTTFMGALATAVLNFNTGAIPPSNLSILEAEIRRIEMLQNSIQTGTYPATELQNLLNQHNLNAQTLMQMLSNISKMLNDTAKSIIRRLG